MYWAQALANQTDDAELAAHFTGMAESLAANEQSIVSELIECQGSPMDLGGYYFPNTDLATHAMRPSATFNAIIDAS